MPYASGNGYSQKVLSSPRFFFFAVPLTRQAHTLTMQDTFEESSYVSPAMAKVNDVRIALDSPPYAPHPYFPTLFLDDPHLTLSLLSLSCLLFFSSHLLTLF